MLPIDMKNIVYILICIFIGYFGLLTSLRHYNFYSLRLDLGNMDQTVWNVAQGNGFVFTDPTSSLQVSRLAYHADFFLILLAPLYWLWSSPYMLLWFQVVIVGLGAIPVYWIAEKKLKSPSVASLFAASYLFYPPLHRALMYDFHAVTLATSFLLYAYWYMDQRRYGYFILFSILAGLCKEQLWIVVGCMGIYIAWFQKQLKLGGTITTISFIVFMVLMKWVIPANSLVNEHFALKYISDFSVNTLLYPDRLWYVYQLLSPLGFLSLIVPWKLLFAVGDIGLSLVSNNGLMRQIDFQYHSAITPFIFVTAIDGFAVLAIFLTKKGVQDTLTHLGVWVASCVMTATYVWGVVPYGAQSLWWMYPIKPVGYDVMTEVIRGIDAKDSVSVTDNLGAQVAQRRELYNFPVNALTSDYVLVKLDDPNAWPSIQEQQNVTDELMISSEYELIAHVASFSAFRKKDIR